MKYLYAKLTNDCNLSCPHCNVLCENNWNEEKFFDEINKFDGEIIAFGGEPTLYRDRLIRLLQQNKTVSITTNLMILDDELISYYKKIHVGTSWNLNRFSDNQYQTWLKNLKLLEEHSIEVLVLITMTEDLIRMDINKFMRMINLWDKEYKSIRSVLFEHLVDSSTTQEFFNQCDDWLCKIHSLWKKYNIQIENRIDDDVFHWRKNCSEIYTLEPDGSIRRHCPHPVKRIIREECLTCEYSDICQPCILQQHCSFPKKLYELIKNE